MADASSLPILEIMTFYKEHYDTCSFCSRQFNQNDYQYLGVDFQNKPALACEKCKKYILTIASSYSYAKRLFKIPSNTSILWRYTDFVKYVSLLKEKVLYFTVARNFKDPFEGAIGLKKREGEWNKDFLGSFSFDSKEKAKIFQLVTTDPAEDINPKILEAFKYLGELNRDCHFINCWHMNEYESEAMWKLYSKDTEHAIAIRTTYQRLYRSLHKNPLIDIGEINYIDYENQFVEPRAPFWYKRKSFQYENEVRAIHSDFDSRKMDGVYAPIDIKELIEAVYVSPDSSDWFLDLVNSVSEKYGYIFKIVRSKMTEEPFY